MKKILFIGLLLCSSVALRAEYIKHGDFTITQDTIFDGDLIIINGDLDIKYSLTVNGDVKIISGKVEVLSDNGLTNTVDLYVRGDLIVTNTEMSGSQDATINIPTGSLVVTGEVFTRSAEAGGFINGRYGIKAGAISASGKTSAYVITTDGDCNVVGSMVTDSDGNARVEVGDSLYAGSITTNSKGSAPAYISVGGAIEVVGEIHTRAPGGGAYVLSGISTSGGITAGSIMTNGDGKSSIAVVPNSGSITVIGDLVTTSSRGDANIDVTSGTLSAGSIATNAIGWLASADGSVIASGAIDVRNGINAYSGSGDANILSEDATIAASSLSTRAVGDGSIDAETGITIRDSITTKATGASGAAYVSLTSGNLSAGSITTDGDTTAHITLSSGNLDVRGSVVTKGVTNAMVTVSGGIKAGSIIAQALTGDTSANAYVLASSGTLVVDGKLETKSTGVATVSASGSITAQSIKTSGAMNSFVQSSGGSITVDRDLYTNSSTADAYVSAGGAISAFTIKTSAPTGSDGSIKAAPGISQFQASIVDGLEALTLKDVEINFDRDYEFNTALSLLGTCTINGKGHQLNLGANGNMIVGASGTLWLNNITINNIAGNGIACLDDAGTIRVNDTTWSLTGAYNFEKGSLEVDGEFMVNGPGKAFNYKSTQASSVNVNSTWTLGPKVHFNYNTGATDRLGLSNSTSRIHFDNSSLFAVEDLRLQTGKLIFDGTVTFSVLSLKTLYFGNSSEPNNIVLDPQVGGELIIMGTGTFTNQNV